MSVFNEWFMNSCIHITMYRAVASGGGGGGGLGGLALPPVFGQTVNPISTRGADYTHHSTTSPPDFQTLRRACLSSGVIIKIQIYLTANEEKNLSIIY